MGNGLSSALNPAGGRGVISIPDGYTTPKWPSLYIPTIDTTEDQQGIFLYEAEAIWHFTLYWSLLLLCSLFLVCALLASFTLFLSAIVFRPRALLYQSGSKKAASSASDASPPETLDPSYPHTQLSAPLTRLAVERLKRKRPPFWPILILPIAAVIIAALIAVVTGTVVGFALAAIYSGGGFSMSTWVPFLWALIIPLVLIISSYSTLTSIL
ncbi:uncharacterized protein L203_102652 [Cryptococcus depauperatus CBS 7841]|uniref:Uncharacterized protein n=1 Tax=Cryptococcus depauperatus CBS 7841 TaxID=1295531 RepID=A0A1E3IDV1_9TREE|nr:hypothetical protein L203_04017 [Cryptococcus depauperatus CBS 7841]